MLSKLASMVQRWQKVIVIVLACFLVSGCVDYEVGVKVDSPYHGVLSQRIRLDDRLSTFSGGSSQAWLANIEQRVRRVHGKARRLSNQEILVTVPFTTAQDLEKKFNQFFSPELDRRSRVKQPLELPKIESKFVVQSSNLLLLEHRRLVYDIDLRSLGVTAPDGTAIVNPSSVINLEFGLTAPWGARSFMPRTKSGVSIPSHREGKQLVWTLQPGQKNHIEAGFWMPNPLGIGTVFVIAIVAAGIYFKNQQGPTISAPPTVS
jgi:hypothetical protein